MSSNPEYLNIKQLKNMCKNANISRYSRMTRAELLKVLDLKEYNINTQYPHSEYIKSRLDDFIKNNKYDIEVRGPHEKLIRSHYDTICTKVINSLFTKAYVKKYPCADCGLLSDSKDRCHALGEERIVLLKRALERVYPDTSVIISLMTILIAFIEEHINSNITFKCKNCHLKENKSSL